jgi:hypothetical protein
MMGIDECISAYRSPPLHSGRARRVENVRLPKEWWWTTGYRFRSAWVVSTVSARLNQAEYRREKRRMDEQVRDAILRKCRDTAHLSASLLMGEIVPTGDDSPRRVCSTIPGARLVGRRSWQSSQYDRYPLHTCILAVCSTLTHYRGSTFLFIQRFSLSLHS